MIAHTKVININDTHPEPEILAQAASMLQEGKLVAFSTETVYGVAANLKNEKADSDLTTGASDDERR